MANVVSDLPAYSSYFEVLPSAARTTAPDTKEYVIQGRGYEYTGLHLIVDITAVTATPSITVTVSGVDRVSGKTYTLLSSAALTATGTTVLKVGPGITAAANLAVADQLPPIFRVSVAHADADSITYSVGGMLV